MFMAVAGHALRGHEHGVLADKRAARLARVRTYLVASVLLLPLS